MTPALIATRLRIWLLILTGGSPALWAGPVNSPRSYPFSVSNSQGDTLSAGDLKILFQGRALDDTERSSATHLATAERIFPRFSGGIAEPKEWQENKPFAIACSNRSIARLDPRRSTAFPGGRWDLQSLAGAGRYPLQCGMLVTGSYAWLDTDARTLRIDDAVELPVPTLLYHPDMQLVAGGDRFWVISPQGPIFAAEQQGTQWIWKDAGVQPFGFFEGNTRIVGHERLLLRADADGVWLAQKNGDAWNKAERLPLNPCGEVCGVSLARDDSWLVSGYWGHYLGQGRAFSRLNFPLSAQEDFGVAIAHQGLGGLYVYLGADDGDRGLLPAWTPPLLPRQVKRWMVWSTRAGKRGLNLSHPDTENKAETFLAQLPPTAVFHQQQSLRLSVWNGPLPDPIPSHWIAWEAETPYDFDSMREETSLPLLSRASNPSSPMLSAWWRDELGLTRALELVRAAGVTPAPIHAAVIDSGIDPYHPWLKEQRWLAPEEIPGNGLDDDGNGWVDDQWGYDFVEEDAQPQDEFGHGTHVAGLLMGRRGEELWSAAPNLRLTVVRALDRYGKSNSIDLARAIVYALDRGATLINCSWGGGPDTQALRDVFALARARGTVLIASAGNDSLNTDIYPEVPKNYPGLLSAGAHDANGRLASFSNFGPQSVSWLTPGTDILSTLREGTFGTMSGTSMASPIAASAYAWIYGILNARNPSFDQAFSQDILQQTTEKILCETADTAGLAQKSRCGRIRLDLATERALEFPRSLVDEY